MSPVVDASEMVQQAIDGGMPADTMLEAMQAAVSVAKGQPYNLGRVGLGNATGIKMAVVPFPGEVVVAIEGWSAYALPASPADWPLHWTYVREKFTWRGHANNCDAVGLTLLLSVILRRQGLVSGACECPTHRGL